MNNVITDFISRECSKRADGTVGELLVRRNGKLFVVTLRRRVSILKKDANGFITAASNRAFDRLIRLVSA